MKPLSSSRARLTAAVRAASPAPVLLASWLVALIYAFPGQLSEQAAAALEEARAGAPSDAVSAPMVALWRLTDGVIDGPAGLWVLQSLLVLGGLHAVACRLLAPRPAAWVAAGTFLAP
ncbi:MAG TPA: hypothetical protein PKU97_19840, partial [Kofleriaceae bacterium]|nr:hypothetical protein [Kofleriaceae bacterium]